MPTSVLLPRALSLSGCGFPARKAMTIMTAFILALALVACAGTPFEWSSARQIKVGMTEHQVQQLMGTPYLVRSSGGTLTWIWSYANSLSGSARSLSVVFQEGKVIEQPSIPDSF